jgi:hypothetical protein
MQAVPLGLLNPTGEKNCFLNTAIQVLWHLQSFRILVASNPCSKRHSCVACELKRICLKYSRKKETRAGGTVSTRRLRRELAKVDRTKFEAKREADSVEALAAILGKLHASAVHDITEKASDIRCSPLCTAHTTFGLSLVNLTSCGCGETTCMPWDYCTFFLTVYVAKLTSSTGDSARLAKLSPEELLRSRVHSSVLPVVGALVHYFQESFKEKASCPVGRCPGLSATSVTSVLGLPTVVAFSLVWPETHPSCLSTLRAYAALPSVCSLAYLNGEQSVHNLLGFILYSGSHYIALLRSEQGLWYSCDDKNVRRLKGDADFLAVVTETLESNFHPVAVFYEQNRSFIDNCTLTDLDWLKLEQLAYSRDIRRRRCGRNRKGPQCCSDGLSRADGTSLKGASKGEEVSMEDIDPSCGWACNRCAFINSKADNHCGLCSNEPRGHISTPSQVSAKSACVQCLEVRTQSLRYCYHCLTQLSVPCACKRPKPVELCSSCSKNVHVCAKCQRLSWSASCCHCAAGGV